MYLSFIHDMRMFFKSNSSYDIKILETYFILLTLPRNKQKRIYFSDFVFQKRVIPLFDIAWKF